MSGMKGGFYLPKGRNQWRVWVTWKGKRMFINKALDGTKLDSSNKAEAVLREIHKQIDDAMFDPALWENGGSYKTEWEIRQLIPHYDKIGICGICEEKTKICQDHDHRNGLIRGKLCRNCNLTLGILKENKEKLVGALKYLLFWEKQDLNRENYDEWKKTRRYKCA